MQFVTDPDELKANLIASEMVTRVPEGSATGYIVVTIDRADDITLSTNSCCKKHLMAHLLELLIRLNEWEAPPVQLN